MVVLCRAYGDTSPGRGAQEDMSSSFMVPGGPERNAAFSRFKRETADGQNLNAVVKERNNQLRDIKNGIKVGLWSFSCNFRSPHCVACSVGFKSQKWPRSYLSG